MSSRVISKNIVHRGKWIQLTKIQYKDGKGIQREWDCAERTTTATDQQQQECDCVDIVALVKGGLDQTEEDRYVLCVQYRPPLDSLCVEFPAGLIDQGESAEEAALRELLEETGYIGRVVKVSPLLALEPGMTNEIERLVFVEVDGHSKENQRPRQQLQDEEEIEVILVPRSQLLATLESLAHERGCVIDAKLYTFAVAASMFT